MNGLNKWIIPLLILLVIVSPALAAPAKISLDINPLSGDAPLTIKASENSGDKTIIDWYWDFGDGNRAYHESKIEYTYEKAGEYKLVCTVINDKAEETSDSVIILVKDVVPPVIDQKPDENTITKTAWQGPTPITAAFSAKAAEKSKTELDPYEKAILLSDATDIIMKAEKYPLDISKDTKTIITIEKYRCTSEVCGYWITAKRDGQGVATNSPVWISPPPYIAVISESYDPVKNEETFTLKEDPKDATFQVLRTYVSQQPLGKGIVGTKG
jgi:PKD repeat protein